MKVAKLSTQPCDPVSDRSLGIPRPCCLIPATGSVGSHQSNRAFSGHRPPASRIAELPPLGRPKFRLPSRRVSGHAIAVAHWNRFAQAGDQPAHEPARCPLLLSKTNRSQGTHRLRVPKACHGCSIHAAFHGSFDTQPHGLRTRTTWEVPVAPAENLLELWRRDSF